VKVHISMKLKNKNANELTLSMQISCRIAREDGVPKMGENFLACETDFFFRYY